jgi:hypothetical protein
MKIKFNKTLINQILFIICVVVPFFNNYEFSFIVWSLVLLSTIKNNYSIEFIKYVSIFIVVLLISIIVGLFFNHEIYYIIRDVTYLLKPITGLILGYQLFSNKIKNPFQFIVFAGVAIACYHLFLVFYGIIIEGARTVRGIREHGGYFNDFEVYTLIILLFNKKLELGFSKKKNSIFILILAVSSFFYLARTNFIQFIILFIAMKELMVLNLKTLKYFGAALFLVIIGFTAIFSYNPVRNGKGFDEFLYKIKIIPTEAFSTKINRDDWKDFHDNYRSYENIRTIEQLSYNNTYIFGEGSGSKVDLKQKVYLGDMFLRYISILHNGYMTVLLKSGIVGLIIYLLSIFYFFFLKKPKDPTLKNIYYLFIGTAVFLIISNWVFMGFYNLLDTKSLLIGFLFAYRNNIIKNLKND